MSEPLLGNDFDSPRSNSVGLDQNTRNKLFARAAYGELMGTFLFLLPIVGAQAQGILYHWSAGTINIACGLVAGFQLVAMIFCFSSLSGSQFNPAITFALWTTRKVSNRKAITFSICQILGGLLVVAAIQGVFPNGDNDELMNNLSVQPLPDPTTGGIPTEGRIFFTEFLTTFVLTYVAFAMAFEESNSGPSAMSVKALEDQDALLVYSTTPQNRTGFAPFAIGFTVFAMSFIGGASGVCMNPARIIGFALVANKWNHVATYIAAELLGAAVAAHLVVLGPQTGEREESLRKPLGEEVAQLVPAEIRNTVSFLTRSVRDVLLPSE